jgi:hypothetical protein
MAGGMTVGVNGTWDDSTTMAGVAAVIGPGVAEISRTDVAVAGRAEGVGGSSVGSGVRDVGSLQPATVTITRRMDKKRGPFARP